MFATVLQVAGVVDPAVTGEEAAAVGEVVRAPLTFRNCLGLGMTAVVEVEMMAVLLSFKLTFPAYRHAYEA